MENLPPVSDTCSCCRNRSRENAWQALCEIRLLHRDASDGKCRCGKRYDDCPEVQIVG